MFRVAAMCAGLALGVMIASAPARAQNESLQGAMNEGAALIDQGEFQHAAGVLYKALEEMRRQGRGETVDAGLFALFLARALEGFDHAQTTDAFRLAASLLTSSSDPAPFAAAAASLLARLGKEGKTQDADDLIAKWLARVMTPGVDDALRITAMDKAIAHFKRTDREDEADRVFENAYGLDGATPQAARYRGLVRLGRAKARQAEGLPVAAATEVDGAIGDLRRASGEDVGEILGMALKTRSALFFEEGLYREALPLAEEADPLLEPNAREETYLQNAAMRMRLLERLDRVGEALAISRRTAEVMQQRNGFESRLAVSARLDMVDMLMRAGQRDEAREKLGEELDRFGGTAEPLLAAYAFEKVASIHIADEDFKAGAEAAENSIKAFRKAAPELPVLMVEPMRRRAEAAREMRDFNYAERAFRELIAQSQLAFRPNHPEVARDLNAFAGFLVDRARFSEAEEIYQASVAMLERAYGPRGLKTAFGLSNMAIASSKLGRYADAIAIFRRCLDIFTVTDRAGADRIPVLINLASALSQDARGAEALVVADEAALLLKAEKTPDARSVFGAQMTRMSALAQLGDLPAAWRVGVAALQGAEIATAEDASNIVAAHAILADIAKRGGDSALSLDVARKGNSLFERYGLVDGRLRRELAMSNVAAALAMSDR